MQNGNKLSALSLHWPVQLNSLLSLREFDFLSSIDLLLMDQTDVFLMQNWSHVLDVMKVLNVIPKEANDTDFSRSTLLFFPSWRCLPEATHSSLSLTFPCYRVQEYALSGHAKFYRQTLIFSRYQDPLINSLFQKWCQNVSGKVKVRSCSHSAPAFPFLFLLSLSLSIIRS